MSVTRINDFQAKDGQADSLRAFLASLVPTIAASAGCRSCQLLQDQDDMDHFVVIEVWDSIEAHKASIDDISAEDIEEVMKLLDSPPYGRYYAA